MEHALWTRTAGETEHTLLDFGLSLAGEGERLRTRWLVQRLASAHGQDAAQREKVRERLLASLRKEGLRTADVPAFVRKRLTDPAELAAWEASQRAAIEARIQGET